MEKGQNSNRPKAGSQIKVDPIKEMKDIRAIKKMLADRPRDLCLFILGVNTNLRASDLLQITAGQVDGLQPGGEIEIREKKTGKARRINLNKACVKAINGLLCEGRHAPSDPLFKGQRGPLTVPSINRLVKQWCKAINLRGNYGSHTLRKTFGYHQRVTFGVSLPVLMETFNHSSQRQTLDYLCVQAEEIKSIYDNEI